jgi:predicted RNase H-like HicB family nuclease
MADALMSTLREETMRRSFSLEYWIDEDWYVGRLKEVPGVFSQGQSLEELEENIRDAYLAMKTAEDDQAPEGARIKEVELEV